MRGYTPHAYIIHLYGLFTIANSRRIDVSLRLLKQAARKNVVN